ncbi:hypothetical protein BGZ68_008166 [Mortierella alpina]|nr:hypothetical protein BGZ68_008166 [Mortierella alpina]
MRFTPAVTFVLVTLASWTLVSQAAPAELSSSSSRGIEIVSPVEGDVYDIGDPIIAQIDVLDQELFRPEREIKLTFQRAIPKPDVNEHLEDVGITELSEDGYLFYVTPDLVGDVSRTNRYRIRFSYYDNDDNHHYVDSGVFHLSYPELPFP